MSQSTPAFFGITAEYYEKYMGPLFFAPTAIDLVGRIMGKPGSILELACGTGQVTRLLKAKFPDAKITATDLKQGMIDIAKQVMGEDPGIEWKAADAQELPFDSNAFDIIVCQFGVMFFPDKLKAFKEAYRVLKSGGMFLFSTWDKIRNQRVAEIANEVVTSYFKDDPPQFFKIPFSMYDPCEHEALLKNSGFKNISVKNIILEGTSPSASDAAKGFTVGNPIYAQICERNESLLPAIQKTLTDRYSKEFGESEIRVPLSEFVAEGMK